MIDDLFSFFLFLVKLIAGGFAVYLVARLVTAAFFQSKHHYEREKHHE